MCGAPVPLPRRRAPRRGPPVRTCTPPPRTCGQGSPGGGCTPPPSSQRSPCTRFPCMYLLLAPPTPSRCVGVLPQFQSKQPEKIVSVPGPHASAVRSSGWVKLLVSRVGQPSFFLLIGYAFSMQTMSTVFIFNRVLQLPYLC